MWNPVGPRRGRMAPQGAHIGIQRGPEGGAWRPREPMKGFGTQWGPIGSNGVCMPSTSCRCDFCQSWSTPTRPHARAGQLRTRGARCARTHLSAVPICFGAGEEIAIMGYGSPPIPKPSGPHIMLFVNSIRVEGSWNTVRIGIQDASHPRTPAPKKN